MTNRCECIKLVNLLSAYTQNGIISAVKAQTIAMNFLKNDFSLLEELLTLEIPMYLIPTRTELEKYLEK